MTVENGYRSTIISGTIFLAFYLFFESLFATFWILIIIPFAMTGVVFAIFFIRAIIHKNKLGIMFGTLIVGAISILEIKDSEIFKSKKLLEASLTDDLSSIQLILRESNKFEVVSSSIIADEKFTGAYQMVDDKIIFYDRPYDTDFIPDTLTIVGDKLIMRFEKNGNPQTGFASYFNIKANNLKH